MIVVDVPPNFDANPSQAIADVTDEAVPHFVYSQKMLMLVDVIFPGWVPFAYLASAQDVGGY